MPLTVALPEARIAFADSVTAFVSAVQAQSEWALFAPSRCHGWARLEVVDHVLAGWQEMLTGFVTPGDGAPTVDAASYWPAFAHLVAGADPVDVLLAQRRRAVSFARPSALVRELRDVADAVLTATEHLADRPCRWQGQVFAAGDFLTIWAVEDVVHHLDLLVERDVPESALRLAAATVRALAGTPLPDDWDDRRVVLAGAGREPAGVPGLPVLG